MEFDENTILELIKVRKSVIEKINDYEKIHEKNKKFSQDYERMNNELISLTKNINSLILNARFSYNRYSLRNLNFPTDYVVFDTETTGLDPTNSEIIEYTFLKYSNNKLVDKLTSLVKPSTLIPEFITNLTGITNEMVENEKNIDEHLEKIVDFINGSIIIGHNILFDIRFLESAVKNSSVDLKPIKFDYIDTVFLARKCFYEVPNHKLETLKNYLNIDTISHRSESDCEVTQIVYMKCASMLINQGAYNIF